MHIIIERINRHIPVRFRKKQYIARTLTFLYGVLQYFDNNFNDQMKNAIHMYKDDSVKTSKLSNDILYEFVRSWVRPVEYAKFELYYKSRQERDTYIPDYEEINIFKKTKKNNVLPDSKYERYLMFKEFFHRAVLCISTQENVSDQEYIHFISDKETVVVKPLKGTKGHGITMVDTKKVPSLEAFKSLYVKDCLIEEVIHQGIELKQFHPSSVNTVRFVTGVNNSGEFHFIFALIRIGLGGSIIDNVSSGGLVALIDMKTGKICTSACRGTERFERHPDTNVKFEGFTIPQWEEVCSLVKTIHLNYPKQRVFGFDLAWTENGWDLVEVNPAPSLSSYQELTGKGIRPFLQEIGII